MRSHVTSVRESSVADVANVGLESKVRKATIRYTVVEDAAE